MRVDSPAARITPHRLGVRLMKETITELEAITGLLSLEAQTNIGKRKRRTADPSAALPPDILSELGGEKKQVLD
jgi:hypothetical protein